MRVVPAPSSLKREADNEARSRAGGIDVDGPAVFFDNSFGDEKPETSAPIALRSEERLKNFRGLARPDSNACVGYNDPDAVTVLARFDQKNSLIRFAHRV